MEKMDLFTILHTIKKLFISLLIILYWSLQVEMSLYCYAKLLKKYTNIYICQIHWLQIVCILIVAFKIILTVINFRLQELLKTKKPDGTYRLRCHLAGGHMTPPQSPAPGGWPAQQMSQESPLFYFTLKIGIAVVKNRYFVR